jgi:hypothetical protein
MSTSCKDGAMASAPTLPEWVYVFVNPGSSMAVMNLKITGQYTSSVLAALSEPGFAASYARCSRAAKGRL